MAIALNDNIKVNAPKPSEERYLNNILSYSSTTQVDLSTVGRRYIGLTVNVNGEEYWYKDTINDGGLIAKSFGAVNGIAGTGTTNTIPKWGSVSGLTNSRLTDNGSYADYFNVAGNYNTRFGDLGGNQGFWVKRSGQGISFNLGNAGISQDNTIFSDNTYGFSLASTAFLSLKSNTSVEGLRIFGAGQVMIIQTPTIGANNDFILTRNSSGLITQISQSGVTDINAVHKTGNEDIYGIKTFRLSSSTTDSIIVNDLGNSTILKATNAFGSTDFQLTTFNASQGGFRAGTPNAYIEGRNAGPTYLSVSVPVESPKPTQNNHLITKNYLDTRLNSFSTLSGTPNYIPKFGSTTALTNSNIIDNGTAVTINTLANIIYNNNNFQGVNIQNTNTGTNSLTGVNIKDLSFNNIGGFTFAPSNYANPVLQNTVLFYTAGAQKIGFATNTSGIGSRTDMYFTVNPSFPLNATNPNQIQILGVSRNIIINYAGTDSGHNFQVNGTTLINGNTTIIGSITATTFVKSGGTASQYLMADGSVSTGATAPKTYWSAGTGINAIVVVGDNNIASGNNSLAEGLSTSATGIVTHAEGFQTLAQGHYSHAEGSNTTAFGQFSHAEGNNSTAFGDNSYAGGLNSQAVGITSFVYGDNSVANNINVNVFGANITGNTANTTYIDRFNIKTVPTGTSSNLLGIDSSGNVITSTLSVITGSGLNSQVAFFNSNNGITGDTGFIWDNTNKRLSINTATPTGTRLTIVDNISGPGGNIFEVQNTNVGGSANFAIKNSAGGAITIQSSSAGYVPGAGYNSLGTITTSGSLTALTFNTNGDVSTGGIAPIKFRAGGYAVADTMTVIAGNPGKVLIGTTTDNTIDRLQVNGTARFDIADGLGGNFGVKIITTGGTITLLGGNSTYSYLQSSNVKPLAINPLGNITLIGYTANASVVSDILQVNGGAFLRSTLTLSNSLSQGTTPLFRTNANATAPTGMTYGDIYVDRGNIYQKGAQFTDFTLGAQGSQAQDKRSITGLGLDYDKGDKFSPPLNLNLVYGAYDRTSLISTGYQYGLKLLDNSSGWTNTHIDMYQGALYTINDYGNFDGTQLYHDVQGQLFVRGKSAPTWKKYAYQGVPTLLINTLIDNGTDNLQVNGSLLATTIKKLGGTPNQYLMADGSISTLSSTNGITGSGVSSQVAFFNSTNSISGSTGFTWDNTNQRLTLSGASTGSTLDVYGNLTTGVDYIIKANSAAPTAVIAINATKAGGAAQVGIILQKNNINTWAIGSDFNLNNTKDFYIYDNTNGASPLFITNTDEVRLGGKGDNNTQKMTIKTNGNVLIGTTTDAGGYLLQVQGNALISGIIYASSWIQLISGYGLLGSGGGTSYFKVLTGNNWLSDIKIKYNSDLSASYDARTLIDKGYLDTRLVSTVSGTTNYLPKFSSSGLTNSNISDNGTLITLSSNTRVIGSITADTIIKSGGASDQFLKADGSVDNTKYSSDADVIHTTGDETKNGSLTVFSVSGAAITTISDYDSLVAISNGSTYSALIAKNTGGGDLARFLDNSNNIMTKISSDGTVTSQKFVKTNSTSSDILMGDGSTMNIIDGGTF